VNERGKPMDGKQAENPVKASRHMFLNVCSLRSAGDDCLT